jgi:CheY-like chemotaxis protein
MTGRRAVLVVDDNREIRDLLKTVLQEHGFPVRTAKHGVEALEKIELDTFSVILLDIQMPVMDGESFVRAYRAVPGHQAHLVVMTAGQDARVYAEHVGADHYLAKPFDLDDVISIVGGLADESA